MRRIGIEPGKSLDFDGLAPAVKKALEAVPEDAQKLMLWKVPTLARVVNQWSMNTDTMGVYGNYYLKRAIVAQVGLGANLPEDAIYPAQSRRRRRQATRRGREVHDPLRQGSDAPGERLLVDHTLRQRRVSSGEQSQPVRGQ